MRARNRTRPCLFFEHNPSPSLPLNALHRNALQARQKKKWRGNASRCYIPRHRCGQMLCKQRVQHAIPSPSSVTQTGHDHFAAIIHRREHLCAPVRAPLHDFFRVASPRRFARTLWKMFYRADLSRPLDSPMRNDPPRYILPPHLPSFSTNLFGLRSFLGRVSIRESRFYKLEWNWIRVQTTLNKLFINIV